MRRIGTVTLGFALIGLGVYILVGQGINLIRSGYPDYLVALTTITLCGLGAWLLIGDKSVRDSEE